MIIKAEASQIFNKMRERSSVVFPCAGRGTCGKCKVRLLNGPANPATLMDKKALSQEELDNNYRLACCLRGNEEVEVLFTNSHLKASKGINVLTDGKIQSIDFKPVIFVENNHLFFDETDLGVYSPDSSITCLAVDVGTTTIVVTLIDIIQQIEVGSESAINPQITFGQDVMSRLSSGQREPENFVIMQRQILDTITELGRSLLLSNGYVEEDLYGIFVAGNAVMNHILLGVSPLPLGFAPYPLQFEGKGIKSFESLGLEIFGKGYLICVENISAYVGGDIMAGILSTDLGKSGKTQLLVDIGTNGEMVLVKEKEYYSTSCAAGPALEGMNITCGMIAQDGAIEEARFMDNKLRVHTIRRRPAQGICGSGILALIREFFIVGLITERGKIANPEDVSDELKSFIDVNNKCLWVDKGKNIYISQKDIRQIQMAKGAILSGIQCLLSESHTDPSKVEEVLIAGQFGSHVSQDSLIELEVIPREFKNKIEYVGNTSKTGAVISALSRTIYHKSSDLLPAFHQIDLSSVANYDRIFAKACLFTKYEEDNC